MAESSMRARLRAFPKIRHTRIAGDTRGSGKGGIGHKWQDEDSWRDARAHALDEAGVHGFVVLLFVLLSGLVRISLVDRRNRRENA
jgi:hypothetical protein